MKYLFVPFQLSNVNCILGRAGQYVTCGSVIKLQNLAYKVRLHSHDVKYGSGSGQQSVTGTDSSDDANSHWAVYGPLNQTCKRGYADQHSKFVIKFLYHNVNSTIGNLWIVVQ